MLQNYSFTQFQDFISPKLRKVIDFLRARFTRGQNRHNQQDQRGGDHENVEMEVINPQDPEQDLEEGNREMVEMEVLDVRVPEQTKQDEGMAGTLHVVVVEVSDQAKRSALVPREADLGEGNLEMSATEVLDDQGPEQEEIEEEQQNQQEIEDKVQHDDVEGVGEGRMVELAPVRLPPPEQEGCGMMELTVVGLPPPEQEQETEEISESGGTQHKLSFKREQKDDKKLDSAKCKSKTHDSSSTGSKGSLGEETVIYETAL